MRWQIFPLVLLLWPAIAQSEKAVSQIRAEVTADTACEHRAYAEFEATIHVCKDALTAWYFTIPTASLPNGYIRRTMIKRDNAWVMQTTSDWEGDDALKPAFDAWAARLARSIGP